MDQLREERRGEEGGRERRREREREREDSSTYEKINLPNFLDLGLDLIPAQHTAKLWERAVLPIN